MIGTVPREHVNGGTVPREHVNGYTESWIIPKL